MKQVITVSEPTETKQIAISRRGKGVIAFLFILGAIGFTDKSITSYLSVPIINEFHLSLAQWGIISGSFFWLYSLSSLLVGAWSDRIGTTRALSLVAVAWTVVQAATGFVTSFPLLLLSRVGLGIGEGPYTGVAMTAATKWLPRERRGLGFALVTSGNLLGPALLTPLLIVFALPRGWRFVFFILSMCSLLWLVGWAFVGREGPQSGHLVKEVLHQKGNWASLLPLLFSRNMMVIMLAMFIAYWMQALSLSWLATYLIDVRHLTFAIASIVGSLVVLCTALIQILLSMQVDRLFRHTGKLRVYVFILSVLLVLTAVLNYSAMLVAPVALSILFLCLQPNGTVFPIASVLITNISPIEHRGAVQGASIALATTGAIIGPTLAGSLLQGTGKNLIQGFQTVYLISGGLLLLVALAAFLFIRLEETRSAL